MSVLATEEMSAAETEQLSSVATGQMSAVETRQMSSVARADICLFSTHNVEVSESSTVPLSLRSPNCGNVTMFKSQKVGPALNRRKWHEMGPEWSPGLENPTK